MGLLRVVHPLVVLHGKDERHHYLYSEAVVEPSLYNDEQIKSLTKEGALAREADPDPVGAQPDPQKPAPSDPSK